ncbi:MAG: glycosyltransferase, partial [Clostridiales bacterium]|nr:glycosyltransferase [Clostridiales bacterium]
MITISLCMIVKNEEETLPRCLSCVRDAVDEIVVVDTGSTDRTKQVAAAFTDKIYDFQWIDDFSAARNAA